MLSSVDAQRLHLIDHSDDLYGITQQKLKNFSQGCMKIAGGMSVLEAKQTVSSVLTRGGRVVRSCPSQPQVCAAWCKGTEASAASPCQTAAQRTPVVVSQRAALL